jgi:hypothetical protein
MKQIWKGLMVAGTLLTAAQLPAQSYKPVTVGIAAGAAIPVGDLADSYNTGYNGTIALSFNSVGTPIGFRVDGMYNKIMGRDDIGINQPDARILGATANLVYTLPGVGIRPYLIGGAGYYSSKVDVNNAESTNKFGLNGGIGAVFPLSGFSTFVEARYHHMFTDVSATQFIPVTFGIFF